MQEKRKKCKTNGCGDYDFFWNFDEFELFGFNECCNKHDTCYSTCREDKSKCDGEFKNCLKKKCFESFCLEVVHFLFFLTESFGCEAYSNSQKNVCVCN